MPLAKPQRAQRKANFTTKTRRQMCGRMKIQKIVGYGGDMGSGWSASQLSPRMCGHRPIGIKVSGGLVCAGMLGSIPCASASHRLKPASGTRNRLKPVGDARKIDDYERAHPW